MASRYNSTPVNNGNVKLDGNWEDVKDYTTAIVTLNNQVAATTSSGAVEWAHTTGRTFPVNSDIVASENIMYRGQGAQTFQFDHRARWFRVNYQTDASYDLQTVYKKAPTQLKIVDDDANVVRVNSGAQGNSLYTVLTDSTGTLLKTTSTSQTTGSALYTHLADASGTSLATTAKGAVGHSSLFVGLRDGFNNPLNTTKLVNNKAANNALYVRPGDASGSAQASTGVVNGAGVEGVALFGALSDSGSYQISTTRNNLNTINSLYVHLTDNFGDSISALNPLPVISTEDVVGSKSFNIPNGINKDFIVPSDLSGTSNGLRINLYNLFVYNDSPSTIFLKVHDTSVAALTNVGLNASVGSDDALLGASLELLNTKDTLRYNLAVQPGKARDIVIPGGASFYNGVAIRASTRYLESSTLGPATESVFVNGTYSIE